jgi:thioredoxin reductase (NADPH)
MHDLIIIGAGPAGLTAAIYAGRFRMSTLVFEKMLPGGQILLSPAIENYPGFPEGISTDELIDKFKKQVKDLGITIEDKEVLRIKANPASKGATYNIKAEDKDYGAKSIIIATGTRPKQLGVKQEEILTGRGVSYCGTCDGPLFKNKEVAVIGGGDRAIEDALFLATYASQVYVIHRRPELRASKILEEKARKNSKINFVLESVAEEIKGENKVEGVKIRNVNTGLLSEIACQGVFIFVGIKPNTGFLKNLLEMNEEGFIITDEQMATSCPGIFACGDCRKKSLYQVIAACGEGAVAADSAHKYLVRTIS